ncbi:MAG: 50S ribosomal protein L29 [Candidatus Yanofskybacteria bacterium]|nr:50S ribosomal protein L29 [Candidatus Yanofskybacteria bacterium]
MKFKDLENKSQEELTALVSELRAKLLEFKFDLAEKKLKNVKQLGQTKKDIARILTRLHK